jgi:Kef-type K+ transport system membrane component KefB
MDPLLYVGIIIAAGYFLGELMEKIRLPKVTGYIIAGILLNPGIFPIIPDSFAVHTDLVTNISLSFITFSVGGTLHYRTIKKLGKSIILITVFEAEFAFLLVILGFFLVSPFFVNTANTSWAAVVVPLSLLAGALASPTDPTATLAVIHEYKAHGAVSSTIMGVAAFDDALGIMNYSLAVAISGIFVAGRAFSMSASIIGPLLDIAGAVATGIAFGLVLNLITGLFKKESEGSLIVIILGILLLCFGTAGLLGVDELLSTMVVGIVVTNFNPRRNSIFRILERYVEELVFVLFFTLSGMQLNFSVLANSLLLVLFFILFRFLGKVSGAVSGGLLAHSPAKVKKYTFGGLIPQGGIVIGLALLVKQKAGFQHVADILISMIIGAAVIHELIGPILSKTVLKRAGEIKDEKNTS